MGKSLKAKTTAGVGLLSILLGALMVFAPAASGADELEGEPYVGNPSCTSPGYDYDFDLKADPVDTEDPATITDGEISVTYETYLADLDGTQTLFIDWSSEGVAPGSDGLVLAVLVKQGDGGGVFAYPAPGASSGTVYVIPAGNASATGISHLSFCHDGATTTSTSDDPTTTSTTEATTTITGNPLAESGRGPEVGGFVVMGTSDTNMEIALIESQVGDVYTLKRGVLDTIPKSWTPNTPAYFLPANAIFADQTVRSLGETVDYKLLTRNSAGLLELDDAPVVQATLGGRPHYPLRPANVKINGETFAEIDATAASELVITWANRNRTYEDGQVIAWDTASVAPEYGQEVVIIVYREDNSEMFTVRGLWSEETYSIPMAWVEEEERIFVRVQTEMGGLRSLQSLGLFVDLPVVASPSAPPASPVVVGSQPAPPDPEPQPTPDEPEPPSNYGGYVPSGEPNWNEP